MRFHVLLFYYFLLVKELFPDYLVNGKSSKRNPKPNPHSIESFTIKSLGLERPANFTVKNVKDLLRFLCEKLQIDDEKRRVLAKQVTGKTWSKLKLADLWTFFLYLKQQAGDADFVSMDITLKDGQLSFGAPPSTTSTPTPMETDEQQPSKKKRKSPEEKQSTWVSVMDLYLHMIVAHMGLFFETMDIKNSSTERGESWLGWGKKILKMFTDRNLSNAQAFRELLIRHHYRALFSEESTTPYDPMRSKIAKEFKKHIFEEIFIDVVEENREDVEAFLCYLEKLGYLEEDEVWKREGDRITFRTVGAAKEAYAQYHGK